MNFNFNSSFVFIVYLVLKSAIANTSSLIVTKSAPGETAQNWMQRKIHSLKWNRICYNTLVKTAWVAGALNHDENMQFIFFPVHNKFRSMFSVMQTFFSAEISLSRQNSRFWLLAQQEHEGDISSAFLLFAKLTFVFKFRWHYNRIESIDTDKKLFTKTNISFKISKYYYVLQIIDCFGFNWHLHGRISCRIS